VVFLSLALSILQNGVLPRVSRNCAVAGGTK